MARIESEGSRIKRRNHNTTHIGRSSGPRAIEGGAKPEGISSKMSRHRNGTYTRPTKPYKPIKYTATETLSFTRAESWNVAQLASGVKKIFFGDEFDVQE